LYNKLLTRNNETIKLKRTRHFPFLFYGILFFIAGILSYLIGVFIGIPRYLFGLNSLLRVQEFLVWYSGIPVIFSLALACVDFFIFFNIKRFDGPLRTSELSNRAVTVALTAYNDEESISDAVSDFRLHPNVRRVIVVSNNSMDRTLEVANIAGAITFNEPTLGYGRCVYRCLLEASKYDDTELVILCEGDRTFRASDIDKLLAYAPHGDIVMGTRTNEPLREHVTQLSTFMLYGNMFVAKLLEAKHFGRCTISDVGTTYKLCHRNALKKLLRLVNPEINLEFNAHFIDIALENGTILVECPITFHQRVGKSKGGNLNNFRSLAVGARMIKGITFGWKRTI
jgi:hypothetical protein